jgi:hypothetical protein
VIQFSDTPPDDKSVLLERRPGGPPKVTNVLQSPDADEAIARANAQVDLAEHALALARRSMWSELEGLRLTTLRASATDVERVEYYKRGVVVARQNLMEALRMRSAPNVVLASR